jgi:hypothetical protein
MKIKMDEKILFALVLLSLVWIALYSLKFGAPPIFWEESPFATLFLVPYIVFYLFIGLSPAFLSIILVSLIKDSIQKLGYQTDMSGEQLKSIRESFVFKLLTDEYIFAFCVIALIMLFPIAYIYNAKLFYSYVVLIPFFISHRFAGYIKKLLTKNKIKLMSSDLKSLSQALVIFLISWIFVFVLILQVASKEGAIITIIFYAVYIGMLTISVGETLSIRVPKKILPLWLFFFFFSLPVLFIFYFSMGKEILPIPIRTSGFGYICAEIYLKSRGDKFIQRLLLWNSKSGVIYKEGNKTMEIPMSEIDHIILHFELDPQNCRSVEPSSQSFPQRKANTQSLELRQTSKSGQQNQTPAQKHLKGPQGKQEKQALHN